MNNTPSSKFGLFIFSLVVIVLLGIGLSSCSSSSSSSSSYSTYKTPQQRYDEKYGAGSYEQDKQLMDTMRNNWNNMIRNSK